MSRFWVVSSYRLPDEGRAARTSSLPVGRYDVEYTERTVPECRGRLRTDEEGKYGYRAVVPVPYFIRRDVQSLSLCTFQLS